ncbi:flippase [Methanosphaera cuniculi]|uniref:flippase n=1 Tax=Methanosphaera cuniculi TaxID=1077256 RepID=UPI0026DBE4CF|nr:flippase [Methanosphaera cuniculi]
MSRLKQFLKTSEYKKILENVISLTGLQFASYILPLITLPYLTMVLGPDMFGLTQYAISLITYFQIVTDYGFNLSATRELAIKREDNHEVSRIFSSVMFIKCILMILTFLVLILIVVFIPKFSQDYMIYILTFGMVIGYMLFPTWFFQAMEYMRYTSILNIIGKLIYTIAIFIFIHNANDYILVPLINSIGLIIVGIMGLYIAITRFNIKLIIPKWKDIKYQLKEGWHVFISTVSINLYTTTNTFLLGLLTNNTLVGYYSIAEKIVLAANGLLTPISQALYPYVSRKTNESKTINIHFIRKLTKLMAIIGFILSALIFIFAKPIIIIIFGEAYINSIILLEILSVLPFIVALSTVFGVQTMLTHNYQKAFSSITLIGGIINIILAIILILTYGVIGIATSFVITESFITISMLIFLQTHNIKIIQK